MAVNSDGVSHHKFPKAKTTKKLWVHFVKNTKKGLPQTSSFSCISNLYSILGCFKTKMVYL